MNVHKTWLHKISLFIFSTCYKDWFLGPNTFSLISKLFSKFPHHILPIQQKQRCSNTKRLCTSSTLSSHVSQPYNRMNLTTAVHARSLIDNQMSHQHHRCLKLENSPNIGPAGRMKLPIWTCSRHPVILLQQQGLVFNQSNLETVLYTSKFQNLLQT